MYKIFLSFCYFILICFNSNAQKANGTVRSLINAEDFFSLISFKEGLNKGYLKVADDKGITFKPDPVDMKQFYKQEKDADYSVNWKPEYAMVSKKGDLGFTTGPYELHVENNKYYGHYLSVWKNNKDKWKLVLDISIPHAKPDSVLKYEYYDPSNYKYPRLIGPQKIKMREDIVLNTDILLGKALKMSGNKNFSEFYDSQVRLYFPEYLPIIGKLKALDFLDKKNLEVISTPSTADRALSGDLAYTYGKATISSKNYNYVRIWKLDDEMKWDIIIDLYADADPKNDQ